MAARIIQFRTEQVAAIVAHAQETVPLECCGLIGGSADGRAEKVYRLSNVAANPDLAYEAAPEELFAAQREMRSRSEQLLAIYHSHPRATDAVPSDTDVRLAYYPDAVYVIVSLAGAEPVVKAFCISERDQSWEAVEYEVWDE
jgi:proteasome lid subunit RPN8/RPN11